MDDLLWIRESNLIEGIDSLEEDRRGLLTWEAIPSAPWRVFGIDPWSVQMVLWIHKEIMIGLRPDIAGKTRTVNVSVGGYRAPGWPSVWHSLCNWVRLTRTPEASRMEIRADHIAFEKIHPFEDGNGRVGRMLMNWQRVRAGFEPLLIKASERQHYYEWFR